MRLPPALDYSTDEILPLAKLVGLRLAPHDGSLYRVPGIGQRIVHLRQRAALCPRSHRRDQGGQGLTTSATELTTVAADLPQDSPVQRGGPSELKTWT